MLFDPQLMGTKPRLSPNAPSLRYAESLRALLMAQKSSVVCLKPWPCLHLPQSPKPVSSSLHQPQWPIPSGGLVNGGLPGPDDSRLEQLDPQIQAQLAEGQGLLLPGSPCCVCRGRSGGWGAAYTSAGLAWVHGGGGGQAVINQCPRSAKTTLISLMRRRVN